MNIYNAQRPWSQKDLKEAAELIFHHDISLSTIGAFVKRHNNNLVFRKTSSLMKDHASSDIYNEVESFVEKMEKFFKGRKLNLAAFVNYDECCVFLTLEGKLCIKQLVSKKHLKVQNQSYIKDTHCGTYLPFVTANGDLLSLYFILSAKFDENDVSKAKLYLPNVQKQTWSTSLPNKIYFSESGYFFF